MPKIDKEQIGKQLAEIEKIMQNLPLQGKKMTQGNMQANQMMQQNINMQFHQLQRIVQDIYIIVHENQRLIFEIKHMIEREQA